MGLTVLSIAFPFATVREHSAGGAEQILFELDRELVRRGHTSLVVASPESEIAGTLIPTLPIPKAISGKEWTAVHVGIQNALSRALDSYPVDLIHIHGLDFTGFLPERDLPALITLHLPRSFYRPADLRVTRPRTYFQCVSSSQRKTFRFPLQFLPEIENGVRCDLLKPSGDGRRDFAMCLGRICPEKGFHLALRAAKRARVGLLLAGNVFPFEAHERYFAKKILPELNARCRYLGPVGLTEKQRLLSQARCLLVPSLVPETSSLVAREALACGTPVVAFARGELSNVIVHGKTGFLVHDVDQMAKAIPACEDLDPTECRRAAEERFDSNRMVDKYMAAYQRVLGCTHAFEAA